MVLIFVSEAKWLLLFVRYFLPFVVTLHDDHASVLYDVYKHLFACQLLNSPIQNHVKFCLWPPLHKWQFSFLIFLWLFLLLVLLSMKINFLILLWFFIVFVEWTVPDDRNIGCGTNIIRGRMKLFVGDFWRSGNLEKPSKRECLKYSSTHSDN